MKAYQILPAGYREKFQINLQTDKQTAKKVNVGGAIVMGVVFILGHSREGYRGGYDGV